MTEDDPFVAPSTLGGSGDVNRVSGGRYRLPDLIIGERGGLITGEGSRKGGWKRVTTLVKAISDSYALDVYHQRKLLIGLILRPDLYDLACAALSGKNLMEPDTGIRKEIDSVIDSVLAASGADIGRNFGTAFHSFVEARDAGLIDFARERWRGKLDAYEARKNEHQLAVLPEFSERVVVVLRYGLAGRIDAIADDLYAGVKRIVDTKTQKAFWGWLEISTQLAAYQMADAMWDRARGCYVDMPAVADDFGVVSWAPLVHPEQDDQVDIFNVDLARGREYLELCARVCEARAESSCAGQTVGLLRPAPAYTLVEAYAARLNAVSTLAEGSALWAEITARGMGGVEELEVAARDAAGRVG